MQRGGLMEAGGGGTGALGVAANQSMRLRNEGRVELPLSGVSWRARAHRLAKIPSLPLSSGCWQLGVTGDGESGSCVRASLRDRSPYQRCGQAGRCYIDLTEWPG